MAGGRSSSSELMNCTHVMSQTADSLSSTCTCPSASRPGSQKSAVALYLQVLHVPGPFDASNFNNWLGRQPVFPGGLMDMLSCIGLVKLGYWL
jgi:hypothetical protein